MHRREFLKGSLLTAAALGLASEGVSAGARDRSSAFRIVDTQISLFQWPFRRLPLDSTAALLEKMEERGVVQGWAGSFEGILQRDIGGVNRRLAEECRASRGKLVAFGSVNPALSDWEEDLRRCHEEYGMPGIRLHPNYHGYKLSDPAFDRLLRMAAERDLLVQLSVLMEDTRTHHPLMIVRDVDVTPLPELVRSVPRARVLLLNGGKLVNGALFDQLAALPGIYFEIARVEATGGVARLMRALPEGRVLFGSHAPFFIYESALIKLYESDLTLQEAEHLLERNPARLLGRA